jgi:hypothetical protein
MRDDFWSSISISNHIVYCGSKQLPNSSNFFVSPCTSPKSGTFTNYFKMSIDRYDPIRILGEGSFGKVSNSISLINHHL